MDTPDEQNGILYVVATPIGNLEDISMRALHALHAVDTILAEDTRMTKKICQRYDIHTPVMSMHEHSDVTEMDTWITHLQAGTQLALVSDAGTPTISDPGAFFISRIHTSTPAIPVRTIPGPSAVTAALSISGISATPYTFYGFLPKKKGRKTTLETITASTHTAVFFESPHRIHKTITQLHTYLSPERRIAVVREMTKIHEEVLYGTCAEIRDLLTDTPVKQKGEFVVIVSKQ